MGYCKHRLYNILQTDDTQIEITSKSRSPFALDNMGREGERLKGTVGSLLLFLCKMFGTNSFEI